MRFFYPIIILAAILVIALAFKFLKPLPDTGTDTSFLPKPQYVKILSAGHHATASGLFWIKGLIDLGDSYLTGKEYDYLGHVGELATSLDSLFYTPYYFVGGVVPIQSKDTSDYSVMRRATRVYPDDWRLALYFAIRLANGPYHQNEEAAQVMRRYANSSDTAMPQYVKTIYRTFELGAMQKEIALSTLLEDCTNPAFSSFKSSMKNRAKRILGYSEESSPDTVKIIEHWINGVLENKIHPAQAYQNLLPLIKKEPEPSDTTEAKNSEVTSAETKI